MSHSTAVKIAVIPVAGLGTRFLPVTKAVPKEMLPIVDKPTVQYVVEEAFDSGIEHVVLVQGRHKHAMEDHFDHAYELEDTLTKRGKASDVELLKKLAAIGKISSIRQKQALGLGHAVLTAQPIVGDQPFAVLLGDDIFRTPPGTRPVIGQLIDAFAETGKGQIATMTVARKDVHKYGCAEGAADPKNDRRIMISGLVEKPPLGTEKTDQVVVGRYVLPPSIWAMLARTKPGAGGEIQLTDALALLQQAEGLMGVRFKGRRVDAGDKVGYLEANLLEALTRPDLHAGVKAMIERLAADGGTPHALWGDAGDAQ